MSRPPVVLDEILIDYDRSKLAAKTMEFVQTWGPPDDKARHQFYNALNDLVRDYQSFAWNVVVRK